MWVGGSNDIAFGCFIKVVMVFTVREIKGLSQSHCIFDFVFAYYYVCLSYHYIMCFVMKRKTLLGILFSLNCLQSKFCVVIG